MKKNDLKDKSTEKLNSELKVMKMITGALAGVLIVLFVVNLYGLLSKDNNTAFIGGIVVAISLGAILPLQFSNMKKIKTELNTRNTND
jgi:ABC-type Fe3+-siderophore transport system permease subunit